MPLPFIAALLLGLRHALDPDHLAAVSTLLLNQQSRARQAAVLGLAWGLGHATALFAFGLPVVLYSRALPEPVQRAAEVSIGLIIAALAVRLLLRRHRGQFHVHAHSHGETRHIHAHMHHGSDAAMSGHVHEHAEHLGRSPAASFGIGLIHGVGGSAAAGVLLMATVSDPTGRFLALLIFAGGTALSMSLLSLLAAHTLAQGAVRRRISELIPVLGTASLLFGVWYSLEALQSWW